jgi:hypothetical protein
MHEINTQYIIVVQLYSIFLKSGRFRVESDFESSNFKLYRVSGHSGQVGFRVV